MYLVEGAARARVTEPTEPRPARHDRRRALRRQRQRRERRALGQDRRRIRVAPRRALDRAVQRANARSELATRRPLRAPQPPRRQLRRPRSHVGRRDRDPTLRPPSEGARRIPPPAPRRDPEVAPYGVVTSKTLIEYGGSFTWRPVAVDRRGAADEPRLAAGIDIRLHRRRRAAAVERDRRLERPVRAEVQCDDDPLLAALVTRRVERRAARRGRRDDRVLEVPALRRRSCDTRGMPSRPASASSGTSNKRRD